MKQLIGIISIFLTAVLAAKDHNHSSSIRLTCEHHSIMAFQEGEAESHFYQDDGKVSLLLFSTKEAMINLSVKHDA